MSENYIVINGKRAELTKEQMKQLGIEVEGKKRWRADKNEKYYFVGSGSTVICEFDDNYSCDDLRYYPHNYFKL